MKKMVLSFNLLLFMFVMIGSFHPINLFATSTVVRVENVADIGAASDSNGTIDYQIYNITGFIAFRDWVNGSYTDGTPHTGVGYSFSLHSHLDFADPNGDFSTNDAITDWVPIGLTSTNYFGGNFNGFSNTLFNLKISHTSIDSRPSGLFGYVGPDSYVYSIILQDVDIVSAADNVGALVGYNYGHVSDSSITGTVSITGKDNVGGAVGKNDGVNVGSDGGNIANTNIISTSSLSISGDSNLGGLVGYSINGSAKIADSFIDVPTITITGSSSSNSVGGFIGKNYSTQYGVSSSYVMATTMNIVNGTIVGGFAGDNQVSRIENVYMNIDDLNITGKSILGGFVGRNYDNSTVNESYLNSKNVSINGDTSIGTEVGGFVGLNNRATISKSYVNIIEKLELQTSNYAGGFVGQNLKQIDRSYLQFDQLSITSNGSDIGGLVGSNKATSTSAYIANSYVAGNIFTLTGSGSGYLLAKSDNTATYYPTSNNPIISDSIVMIDEVSENIILLPSNVYSSTDQTGYSGQNVAYMSGNELYKDGLTVATKVNPTGSYLVNFLNTKSYTLNTPNGYQLSTTGSNHYPVLKDSDLNGGIILQERQPDSLVYWADTTNPTFDTIPDQTIYVSATDKDWSTVIQNAADDSGGSLTLSEQTDGVTYGTVGVYSVTVQATDPSNNTTTQTFTVTVVEDPVPENTSSSNITSIELKETHEIEVDLDSIVIDLGSALIIPDYTAYKLYGYFKTDLTNEVIVENKVDTNQVGLYEIIFTLTAFNEHENQMDTVTKTVLVNVIDTDAPVIQAEDAAEVLLEQLYIASASCTDNSGECTLQNTGSVDTTTPGTFIITFMAFDSSGNQSSKIQTVTVKVPEMVVKTVELEGQTFVFPLGEDEFNINDYTVEYLVSTDGVDGTEDGWSIYANQKIPRSVDGEIIYIKVEDSNGNTFIKTSTPYKVVKEQATDEPVLANIEDAVDVEVANYTPLIIGSLLALVMIAYFFWWFFILKDNDDEKEKEEPDYKKVRNDDFVDNYGEDD